MRCFVEGAGVLAPGLAGWHMAQPILDGAVEYRFEEFTVPRPDLLPPVERRRTGAPVKLAIAAGQDALEQAGIAAAGLATVFASSDSDGEVIDEICRTLAGAERLISPTRFHNSVHNAPAGYWSIATGSHAASTSICAMEWSVSAGLIEAMCQVATEEREVMLIAYDVPYPPPLLGARPTEHAFGSAIVFAPQRSERSIASLDWELRRGESATRMTNATLETMRVGNAAARVLPLLAAIATAQPAIVVLDYVAGNSLRIAMTAC